MSEVSNPKATEHQGVSVEHPIIREYVRNAKKLGLSKEEARKRVGMPMEVIDKIYNEQ